MPDSMEAPIAALARLLDVARAGTGQSRRVANFLLAWWNAGQCGGFDLTDLWAVDRSLAEDMTAVFAMVAQNERYPGEYGFDAEFRALAAQWRRPDPRDEAED